ncbi:hypothetical protein [Paraburkholderia sp. LEh10]|uniref:hypothetical protein n=1 Tax=Paraburkholderia sp. LEh10 TaxID=2821353 RepID=UPI001FD79DC7|nr:hypothetical protein [Paraburkholderia sp. LEh10]
MTDATQQIQKNYDDCPYYSFPYHQSAPEHLAAVAHVFGLSAPDVRTARVLERAVLPAVTSFRSQCAIHRREWSASIFPVRRFRMGAPGSSVCN